MVVVLMQDAFSGDVATSVCLPNLLIVGVAKAGTSSLFTYLAQHQDICASDRKELNYFNRFDPRLDPVPTGDPQTLEEYAAHFRHCNGQRYVMEATPSYFYGGQPVIDALRTTLRDPRCLVVLRDPVDRLWSFYNFERGRLGLPRDIGVVEYVETCERLYHYSPDGYVSERPYRALAGGFYHTRIGPWLEAFGDAFKVVFFDDLKGDPLATVKGLCSWLGINADVVEDFEYDIVNKTRQYRNARVERRVREVRRKYRTWLHGHPMARRWMRITYNRLNREDELRSMDRTAQVRLQKLYAEPNQELATTLRAHGYRNLPSWLVQPSSRQEDGE